MKQGTLQQIPQKHKESLSTLWTIINQQTGQPRENG